MEKKYFKLTITARTFPKWHFVTGWLLWALIQTFCYTPLVNFKIIPVGTDCLVWCYHSCFGGFPQELILT